MTQDELNLVLEALKWCHGGEPCGTAEAIAVVEKALAQPEQEPVAYINVEERKLEWAKPMSWNTPTTVKLDKISLYTHPPQRTEPVCPECKAKVLYECVACSSNNYPPQRKENK
jgi:hypothetical protein